MLTLQYRPSTTDGKGVGRWHNYFTDDDVPSLLSIARRYLDASTLVRIVTPSPTKTVYTSRRVSEVAGGTQ